MMNKVIVLCEVFVIMKIFENMFLKSDICCLNLSENI